MPARLYFVHVVVGDFLHAGRGPVGLADAAEQVELAGKHPPHVEGDHGGEQDNHGHDVEAGQHGRLKAEGPKGRHGNDGGGEEGGNMADGADDD